MKHFSIISLLLIFFLSGFSQERRPTVQDLDFLTGKWEIVFEIYDTHNPNTKPVFIEKGWQDCKYEMKLNGVPMFLTCKGQLVIDSTDEDNVRGLGRAREIIETIRYGRFSNSFERIGLYSNWPATGQEILKYDSLQRKIMIRGTLDVQDNMLERYIDTIQFNEDFTMAERTNIANFSDMPISEYNLTLKATYKKVSE